MEQTARVDAEELFRRHAAGVGSFFIARTGNAELAEELTARVFTQVVGCIEQCRGSSVGWLWAICQSVLARYYRDRGRRRLDPPPATFAPAPDETAEQREFVARLPALLDLLSEQQQQLVYLRYFQDLSNTQIADALGIPAPTVAVGLHRALKRLRDALEKAESPTWTPTRP